MCVKIWRVFHIRESIDSELISACLINDYSLIADLHILNIFFHMINLLWISLQRLLQSEAIKAQIYLHKKVSF